MKQAVNDIKTERQGINQEKILWNVDCLGNVSAIKQMLYIHFKGRNPSLLSITTFILCHFVINHLEEEKKKG